MRRTAALLLIAATGGGCVSGRVLSGYPGYPFATFAVPGPTDTTFFEIQEILVQEGYPIDYTDRDTGLINTQEGPDPAKPVRISVILGEDDERQGWTSVWIAGYEETPAGPTRINPLDKALWPGVMEVARYEMRPTFHHMTGMFWDGQYLWAVSNAGGFFKLDTANINQSNILEEVAGPLPNVASAEMVGGYVYVLSGMPLVYVLDPRQNFSLVDTFTLPQGTPSGLTWDGTSVWVADEERGLLYKFPNGTLGKRSYDPLDDYLRPEDNATIFDGVTITENTTWTKDGSPYVIRQWMDILPNVTLVIEPGVRVLFGSNLYAFVRGRILAEGTPEEPIVFSHIDPATRWWAFAIDHRNGPPQPPSVLRHVRIQYAEAGLEVYGTAPAIEYSWIRGLPTGINTGGGFNVVPPPGGALRLVGNAGAPIRLFLGTEPGVDGAYVEILENHVRGILLYDGQRIPTSYIRRNLLEAGLVIDETSRLVVEDNQLAAPIELGEFPSLGNLHEDYVFLRNLVVTDYQVNVVGGNVRNVTARYNTVTNGWGFWDLNESIDPLVEYDFHENNILGGVGEWQMGDLVYRPYVSMIQTLPTQTVNLSMNYWGTVDRQEIQDIIWDGHLDSNEGTVIYEPFLTEPAPYGFARGRVFDAATGRPLSGAQVSIGGTVTNTSVDGYFAITLPSGTYEVRILADGYEVTTAVNVTVTGASITHIEAGLERLSGAPVRVHAAVRGSQGEAIPGGFLLAVHAIGPIDVAMTFSRQSTYARAGG
jgi:hypothetical protein